MHNLGCWPCQPDGAVVAQQTCIFKHMYCAGVVAAISCVRLELASSVIQQNSGCTILFNSVAGNKIVTLVKSGHRGRKGTLLHCMLLMQRPGQHK